MYCNNCGASIKSLCTCSTPYCDPCQEQECKGERAKCVYYNLDTGDIGRLTCLGLEGSVSLELILDTLNERICYLLNKQTPLIGNDTSSVDLTTSGIVGHTLTGNIRISSTSPNRISIKPDGLYDSGQDGKLTTGAGSTSDYLSNLVDGSTDGTVTIATFVGTDDKLHIQPSIDVSSLIAQLTCDMVTCPSIPLPPPSPTLPNVYVGGKPTIDMPTPDEILAGLHSNQDVNADVLADWTPNISEPLYLWYAIEAITPLADKNFYRDNFNSDNYGNMLTNSDLFPAAVIVDVYGVNYYTNITNYKTQVGNSQSTFTLQKI